MTDTESPADQGPNFVRLALVYLGLVALACGPVWLVDVYVNQDGSSHVHSAYVALELLKGNESFSQFYAFNTLIVPNISGHWILTGLLLFVTPIAATKAMVTLTVAGMVAAVGWLRFRVAGMSGLYTSLLFGSVLALNWLWFLGFYNFAIGTALLAFGLGLYYPWIGSMTLRRSFVLAIVLIVCFYSHLLPAGILLGSILILTFICGRPFERRSLIFTGISIAPIIVLLVLYKSFSANIAEFNPTWHQLNDLTSIGDWGRQLLNADPFVLSSRTALPFVEVRSAWFAVFAPTLWLMVAMLVLILGMIKDGWPAGRARHYSLAFTVLFVGLIISGLLAPDDFGDLTGGILSPRIILCGFIAFVPLIPLEMPRADRIAVNVILFAIILFQAAVVFDYAIRTDDYAKQYLAASEAIKPPTAFAALTIIDDDHRFRPSPANQLAVLLSFEPGVIPWNNYELGYNLFPIVARDAEDRDLAFHLGFLAKFRSNDPPVLTETMLSGLDVLLMKYNGKIDKIVLYGRDPRIEAVIFKWYDREPVYSKGETRIFRRTQ